MFSNDRDVKEILAEVKEIRKSVTAIDKTMAVNTESLVQHEKRTTLSEQRIKALEYWALGILATALITALIKIYS